MRHPIPAPGPKPVHLLVMDGWIRDFPQTVVCPSRSWCRRWMRRPPHVLGLHAILGWFDEQGEPILPLALSSAPTPARSPYAGWRQTSMGRRKHRSGYIRHFRLRPRHKGGRTMLHGGYIGEDLAEQLSMPPPPVRLSGWERPMKFDKDRNWKRFRQHQWRE